MRHGLGELRVRRDAARGGRMEARAGKRGDDPPRKRQGARPQHDDRRAAHRRTRIIEKYGTVAGATWASGATSSLGMLA